MPAIIKSQKLSGLSVTHGVSTRSLGNMKFGWKGDDKSVLRARQKFFDTLSVPLEQGVAMTQAHEGKVAWVTKSQADEGMRSMSNAIQGVDALATQEKDLFLFGTFADCAPVMVYDSVQKVVGLAHTGWRGVIAGVIYNLVHIFNERANSYPHHLVAYVGPAIGVDHYLIGPDVEALFKTNGFMHDVVVKKTGLTFLDLKQACVGQLVKAGVPFNQIEVSPECTSCDLKKFFSYRQEGKIGAMAALIGIKSD